MLKDENILKNNLASYLKYKEMGTTEFSIMMYDQNVRNPENADLCTGLPQYS